MLCFALHHAIVAWTSIFAGLHSLEKEGRHSDPQCVIADTSGKFCTMQMTSSLTSRCRSLNGWLVMLLPSNCRRIRLLQVRHNSYSPVPVIVYRSHIADFVCSHVCAVIISTKVVTVKKSLAHANSLCERVFLLRSNFYMT